MTDPRPAGLPTNALGAAPAVPAAAFEAAAPAPAAVSTPPVDSQHRALTCARALLCVFYAVCIIGTLMIYGLWQERIMSQPYGDGDYFESSILLVLLSRVVGFMFAALMVLIMNEDFRCKAPLWKYAVISISTVVASICQFEALRYVSFTMQILGKTFKMVPVMLWGVTWSGKKYRFIDYISSFLITGGIVWYMLAGTIAPEHSAGSIYWGLGLLLSFIVLDGSTSWFQEKLFATERTSKYNQMLHINLTSSLLSVATLFASRRAKESLEFCQSHPSLYVDASIMSGSAVVAQWLVYSQVADFGPLAFAATMNVRQVVSVVASYLVYDHAITSHQIAGMSVVFGALCFQSFWGCMGSQEESRPLLSKADGKGSHSGGHAAVILKKTGLASCIPCTGGRDSV